VFGQDSVSSYLMDLNRDTLSVVLDRDFARLSVYCDPNFAHVLIVLLVVCGVDQDLVENLVETGHVRYVAELHAFVRGIVDPHLVCLSLDRANVCVGTLHDVFQMGKLRTR
jgi:hypothetical protein